MSKIPKQVAEVLSKKHIAVAGVSRDFQQPANAIYRNLKGAGYQVYAINPNAERAEGDACYPDLHSVPEPVEAVIIVTHPDIAANVVRECADLGIRSWPPQFQPVSEKVRRKRQDSGAASTPQMTEQALKDIAWDPLNEPVTVEFTPPKGEFTFACRMGMIKGKLIVE